MADRLLVRTLPNLLEQKLRSPPPRKSHRVSAGNERQLEPWN